MFFAFSFFAARSRRFSDSRQKPTSALPPFTHPAYPAISGFFTSLSLSSPESFWNLRRSILSGLKSETAAAAIITSALLILLLTRVNISRAETALRSLTPLGAARLTGPLTRITLCPRLPASPARRYPINPDEALDKYLTGSIYSLVGPAVIKNVFFI